MHLFAETYRPLIDQLLVRTTKLLDSIAAQIVILETYDDEMGIYNTSSQADNALSLVSLHEAEDLSLVDPYDREMDRYLNANVLKYMGLSFNEYLELSRYRAEKMLARCDRLATKEAEEAEAAMGPLRNKKLPSRPSNTKPRA